MDTAVVLAKRIIPVVLCRGEEVVKGQKFDAWRSIGYVRQATRLYNARAVDELIILDISATREEREPNFSLIRDLAGDIFSPLTIGGGIRSVEHFRLALENGADKVSICTAAIDTPELIDHAAKRFGSQAVTVSIDYTSCDERGLYQMVMCRSGTRSAWMDPEVWAKECEDRGAGEILLNSVERDGTMEGYDLDCIRRVSAALSIPVVACGGAGSYENLFLALEDGAHGVAASALWAFTDATPAGAAEYLHERGVPVRRP